MALKIRLRQQGRNNRPFYRLVLADARTKRDGEYIEALGWYNPFETEQEKHISIKTERVQYWISEGAEVSENAEKLIAKLAPNVIQFQRQKELAKRAHILAKKKARKKAKASA